MNQKTKINNIEVGDFLSFKASDGNYRVIFCVSVFKEKEPFYFDFAATTINEKNRPTKEQILESGFFGIVNRKKLYFITEQNADSKMWKDHHPEIDPFLVGVYVLTIWLKDFMGFQENFELIENIPIIKNLHLKGNGSMNASSLESLNKLFLSNIDEVMAERRQKAIVISSILLENEKQSKESENDNSFWVKFKSLWS